MTTWRRWARTGPLKSPSNSSVYLVLCERIATRSPLLSGDAGFSNMREKNACTQKPEKYCHYLNHRIVLTQNNRAPTAVARTMGPAREVICAGPHNCSDHRRAGGRPLKAHHIETLCGSAIDKGSHFPVFSLAADGLPKNAQRKAPALRPGLLTTRVHPAM